MKVQIALQIFIFLSAVVAVLGIRCFDCNSRFDPQCEDPFSEFPLGKANCDEMPNPHNVTATFCRKIRQNGRKKYI